MLAKAGITLTEEECVTIGVAVLGRGELEATGRHLFTYVTPERVCAKELILFPRQTCPEHRHPPIKNEAGKEETFRCRWGEVYLYVEGDSVKREAAKASPPAGREHTYSVWHEITLAPGEQ